MSCEVHTMKCKVSIAINDVSANYAWSISRHGALAI